MSLSKKLKCNDELLSNTHGNKMKILQWIMEEWEKKEDPLMDSILDREFDSDYKWVIKMVEVAIPGKGTNSMDRYHRRLANKLFKKYDGYRNGMNFTK